MNECVKFDSSTIQSITHSFILVEIFNKSKKNNLEFPDENY